MGGQIKIDFFSTEDLRTILDLINKVDIEKKPADLLENYIAQNDANISKEENTPIDDRTKEEVQKDDSDLYNISNFSV